MEKLYFQIIGVSHGDVSTRKDAPKISMNLRKKLANNNS